MQECMHHIIFVTPSSSTWDHSHQKISPPTREGIRNPESRASKRSKKSRIPQSFFTHLHVLQTVLLTDASQHVLLAALLHFPRQQQLIQDEVRFLEIEDDIQLAHVAVVLVHLLHVAMHYLERDEFIVGRRAARDKEEGSVAAVDDFGVCNIVKRQINVMEPSGSWRTFVFKEVAHAGSP